MRNGWGLSAMKGPWPLYHLLLTDALASVKVLLILRESRVFILIFQNIMPPGPQDLDLWELRGANKYSPAVTMLKMYSLIQSRR